MKNADMANAHLALLAANVIFMFDSNLFSRFTVGELLEYYKNMGSNEAALRVLCLIIPFVKSFKELADVTLLCKVVLCYFQIFFGIVPLLLLSTFLNCS